MEHRENSDSLRSDQENVAKDEHNSWSQENIDRAISICLGEERLYEYSINEQKARDAATMEQTVQTTALNPPQTQSRVQTSAGVSRERHTQRLSGDEFSTAGDEYTTAGDEYTTAGDEYTATDYDCSMHISRPASIRTVCDSRQGRGHYVKAIPTLRGIGGVDTSPCNSATPMPSVRTVGSFPGLGVPPEASLQKEPAQEAIGTQISEQQEDLWTDVVSNDVDMLWSEDKIRELSIYLNEDPPAAHNTCSRYQYQDKHSLAAEVVADMAAWNVSTARVAAATVNPYDGTSSTNTIILRNAHEEVKKEATSGISGMIRDGGDSSSTCLGNARRVQPGQPLLKPPKIASLARIPFEGEGISENRNKDTAKEVDENRRQVGRGHYIRHDPVGSPAATTVPDQETCSMSKTLLKCRYCPREFCKGTGLREHERVHTRER
eukprot:scpid81131/ scgid1704/ 